MPRGVAAVDPFGIYNRVQASSSLYSGNNIRCAATDGTNNLWTAGAPNGTYYLNPAASPVNVQTNTEDNSLYVKIVNGNLCFSSQKGTIGLYGFSGGGLPKTPGASNLLFATGSSSSPEGFDLSPSQTLAYVADTCGSAGSIQKWTNDGTAWSLAYLLRPVRTWTMRKETIFESLSVGGLQGRSGPGRAALGERHPRDL